MSNEANLPLKFKKKNENILQRCTNCKATKIKQTKYAFYFLMML